MVIGENLLSTVAADMMSKACCEIPEDYLTLLNNAYNRESNDLARSHLKTMLSTAELSKKERRPICQDTGVPWYYIDIGSEVKITGNIQTALERATEKATMETPMRANIVHPLTNVNPGNNVGWGVPYAYYNFIPGADYVKITAIPKGGGGSYITLFKLPSIQIKGTRTQAIKKAIIDHVIRSRFGCPPHIYAVAIGGSPAHTVHLAAKTVFRRPVGKPNPDSDVAELEKDLFESINQLGIGPMGLGGDTTALAVNVEICGSHTVAPPVAVAFNCWAYRCATAKIYADGNVEELDY